jgi:hypothetical protein
MTTGKESHPLESKGGAPAKALKSPGPLTKTVSAPWATKGQKAKSRSLGRPPHHTQKRRALGTPFAGLGMTGYKREEDSPEGVGGKIRVRLRVPPEIIRRDSESKEGGTLHHPIARKNGARWGPRLRSE